jgi:selenoprotein W-related protein
MPDVEIEYCHPCGHLEKAIDTQRALLQEFGRKLDGVRLKTGEKGVFKIRADGEEIFDKSQGYDLDQIKAALRQRFHI